MEIKKIIHLLTLILIVLGCGKSVAREQKDKNVLNTVKQENFKYQNIPYAKKLLLAGVHMFQFKDNKVTIEYTNETIFGVGSEQKFNTYKSSYDLDLGEVDLLRFDAAGSQIYLVELNEGSDFIYNIYLSAGKEMYYLGNLDFDIGEIDPEKKQDNNSFSIERQHYKIHIIIKNEKRQVKKIFSIAKPLQPYKSYKSFSAYLSELSNDEIATVQTSHEYISNLFRLEVQDDQVLVNIRGSKNQLVNDKILEGYESCPDVTLDKIVIKDPYFTIEKYNCTTNYYLKEYLTFKFDKRLLLHKYSVEYTSRQNPDQTVETKHFSQKDFGMVFFEEVNSSFLNQLRQE